MILSGRRYWAVWSRPFWFCLNMSGTDPQNSIAWEPHFTSSNCHSWEVYARRVGKNGEFHCQCFDTQVFWVPEAAYLTFKWINKPWYTMVMNLEVRYLVYYGYWVYYVSILWLSTLIKYIMVINSFRSGMILASVAPSAASRSRGPRGPRGPGRILPVRCPLCAIHAYGADGLPDEPVRERPGGWANSFRTMAGNCWRHQVSLDPGFWEYFLVQLSPICKPIN